jgi:hypothetical protein
MHATDCHASCRRSWEDQAQLTSHVNNEELAN